MKSISLLLNVVLIFLVFYFGCKDNFLNKGNKPATSAYCNDCNTYNSSEKYGMISYNTARMLAENYFNSEGKRFIYNEAGKTAEEDARNIWFDLKILKNFIALIESQACKYNCDTSRHLGIRIYYGKYPAADKFSQFADLSGLPEKFANHHTLFMMPTYWDATAKKHVDFDPLQVAANCNIQPFQKDLTPSNIGNTSQAASYTTERSFVKVKDTTKQIREPQKPQSPKTFYILGGQTYNTSGTSGSSTGEQQNHGDVAPPPSNSEIYPTTP